jgi:K+-sensing histidine kinase KdpD
VATNLTLRLCRLFEACWRVGDRFSKAVFVAVAVPLTFAIRPLFGGRAPLLFFTIAVVLSTAYVGLWAGLFATLLSVLLAAWLFEQSIFSLALSQSSLVLFASLGTTIRAIIHLLQRAKAKVEAARTELEPANKQLSQRTEGYHL